MSFADSVRSPPELWCQHCRQLAFVSSSAIVACLVTALLPLDPTLSEDPLVRPARYVRKPCLQCIKDERSCSSMCLAQDVLEEWPLTSVNGLDNSEAFTLIKTHASSSQSSPHALHKANLHKVSRPAKWSSVNVWAATSAFADADHSSSRNEGVADDAILSATESQPSSHNAGDTPALSATTGIVVDYRQTHDGTSGLTIPHDEGPQSMDLEEQPGGASATDSPKSSPMLIDSGYDDYDTYGDHDLYGDHDMHWEPPSSPQSIQTRDCNAPGSLPRSVEQAGCDIESDHDALTSSSSDDADQTSSEWISLMHGWCLCSCPAPQTREHVMDSQISLTRRTGR